MTRGVIGLVVAVLLLTGAYWLGTRHDAADDLQRRLDAQRETDEIRKAIEDAGDDDLADRLSGGGLY